MGPTLKNSLATVASVGQKLTSKVSTIATQCAPYCLAIAQNRNFKLAIIGAAATGSLGYIAKKVWGLQRDLQDQRTIAQNEHQEVNRYIRSAMLEVPIIVTLQKQLRVQRANADKEKTELERVHGSDLEEMQTHHKRVQLELRRALEEQRTQTEQAIAQLQARVKKAPQQFMSLGKTTHKKLQQSTKKLVDALESLKTCSDQS
jgi:hypothetical protein